jgi:hypothetical protein
VKSEANEIKETRKAFDINKAIRETSEGNLSGLEAEMCQEARREFSEAGITTSGSLQIPSFIMEKRATTVATDYGGKGSTQVKNLQGLIPPSLLEKGGANIARNCTGTVLIPSAPVNATNIKDETTTATDSDVMTSNSIDPVKMASMITVSNQALGMSSSNFNEVCTNQFIKHSNALLDQQFIDNVISASTPSAYGPRVLRHETADASGSIGTVTAANINELIHSVGNSGRVTLENYDGTNGPDLNTSRNCKFIGSPGSMSDARITPFITDSGVGMLQGSKLAGYDALTTSLCNPDRLTDDDYNSVQEVYRSGVGGLTDAANFEPFMFVNFDDVYACYWGGADLIVDEFTSAHLGVTRLIMNIYANAKVGHELNAAYFVTKPT